VTQQCCARTSHQRSLNRHSPTVTLTFSLNSLRKVKSLKEFRLFSQMNNVRVMGRFLLSASRSLSINDILVSRSETPAASLKRVLCCMQLKKLEFNDSQIDKSNEESTDQTPAAECPLHGSIKEPELSGSSESCKTQALKQLGSQSSINN
jgi:hypothetical protein